MVSKKIYGDQLSGLNIALGTALMERLEGSPWQLVSGGNVRSFTRSTAGAMGEWIKASLISGRPVFFLPPKSAGGHVFLIGRIPLTGSPASLTPPPQFVIASDDFTCLWRLVEPVETAKAQRMAAKLVAGLGGREAIDEPVPLPGTMLIRAAGIGLAQRYPVALVSALASPAYHFTGEQLRTQAAPIAALTVDADSVTAAPMEWLWPQVIPVGALSLLGGAPGMGKSQVAISIAATLSSGGTWPTGGKADAGSALVLEAEDDIARTVKPRLIAAGANTRRVGLAKEIDLRRGSEPFEAEFKRRKGLKLIVLSPIRKFIGDAEYHGNTGVRDVLQPILAWAEERRVAVLGICHPPKGKEQKEAFAGSTAFVEIARAAYSVIPDPTSKEPLIKRRPRVLVSAKGNLGPDNLLLNYRIDGCTTPDGIETSRVIWQPRDQRERAQ